MIVNVVVLRVEWISWSDLRRRPDVLTSFYTASVIPQFDVAALLMIGRPVSTPRNSSWERKGTHIGHLRTGIPVRSNADVMCQDWDGCEGKVDVRCEHTGRMRYSRQGYQSRFQRLGRPYVRSVPSSLPPFRSAIPDRYSSLLSIFTPTSTRSGSILDGGKLNITVVPKSRTCRDHRNGFK